MITSEATQPQEIIAALSLAGCRAVAGRIGDLCEMSMDGAPDEPPMVVDSLRELKLFFLSHDHVVDPEIGLTPDGLLLAEWAKAERGFAAMIFLPGGIVQFARVSPAGTPGTRHRVRGKLPRDRAFNAMRMFIP